MSALRQFRFRGGSAKFDLPWSAKRSKKPVLTALASRWIWPIDDNTTRTRWLRENVEAKFMVDALKKSMAKMDPRHRTKKGRKPCCIGVSGLSWTALELQLVEVGGVEPPSEGD
ncbi:MAG: hypothetical protein ABIP56_08255 [Dokdonella sp.]